MTSAVKDRIARLSLAQLGPGLLMAGAAIGVSHLVQSTRAGAMYGISALLFVLLANLMKYPFYEYGHRYAAASGSNLIRAYWQQGRQYFIPFLIISLISAVGSFAVDAFVAAMLVKYLWLPQVSVSLLAVGVLLFCWAIIAVGQYRLFEEVTKWCVIILAIATLCAAAAAVTVTLMQAASTSTPLEAKTLVAHTTTSTHSSMFSWSAVPFIVAFMGWMPGGLELSIWQSLWVEADSQDRGESTDMDAARFDFNVGYVLSLVLACLFLILGSLTLPGQGLAAEPAAFAGQLVSMYSGYIGAWAEPVIGLCAIAAIFSTTFTVVDAYPRTLSTGIEILIPAVEPHADKIRLGLGLVIILLADLLLTFFTAGFEPLINAITILAFIAAPFYAWLNIRSIQTLETKHQPPRWQARLATVGLIYLSGFSLLFIGLSLL